MCVCVCVCVYVTLHSPQRSRTDATSCGRLAAHAPTGPQTLHRPPLQGVPTRQRSPQVPAPWTAPGEMSSPTPDVVRCSGIVVVSKNYFRLFRKKSVFLVVIYSGGFKRWHCDRSIFIMFSVFDST